MLKSNLMQDPMGCLYSGGWCLLWWTEYLVGYLYSGGLYILVGYLYSGGLSILCRMQSLSGRASDSRLRGPGFESCAAVLKPWASFSIIHCSSSLNCINEYRAIDK